MITHNTDKLRREVAAHVAGDTIVQGIYWDEKTQRGCFLGCLGRGGKPAVNESEYGLPVMLQRIAENIFEALPADEAKRFFATLPDAVGCDGKDLSKVSWQFLAAELRSLPPQTTDIQAVIDPVITGLDLLAAGQDWPHASYAAVAAAADAAYYAASAAAAAAKAHVYVVNAHADYDNAASYAASYAAEAAAAASYAAAYYAAADAAANVYAAVRLRQRDLLLQLISQAPTS